MPKLTLSMIVKNEEKYLRECLESVISVADEIIIVDTGSTDKTLEIANEFKANVYNSNWVNDFSAARNYALSKSTGDWILYLDADERLSPKSINEFKVIINSSNRVGVKCLVNSVDTIRKSSQMMKYIRLFKNDSKINFRGKAHEQIEQSLIENNYKIIDSDIEIIHIGYNVNENVLKEKAKRNLDLLLSDYSKQKTSYLAYQIANSYSVLKDERNKNYYYSEALKDKKLNKEFRSICFLHLADFEMRNNNLANAKELVDAGIKENKSHSLLNLLGTQVYSKFNDFRSAIHLCKNALESNKNIRFRNSQKQDQTIQVDENKIIYQGIVISLIADDKINYQYFLNLLDREKNELLNKVYSNELISQYEIEKLIEITEKDNLELIIKLMENYNHHEQKLNYLSTAYEKYNSNPKLNSAYGSFLLSLNKLELAQSIFESGLAFEDYDDSIIFYLSSLYVRTSNFEKLIILLEKAEIRAQDNAILQNKLNLLKEKLSPYFNLTTK